MSWAFIARFCTHFAHPLTQCSQTCPQARLIFLSPAKLRNLEHYFERIETDGVESDCVEYGVALGGSAILIAKLMGPDRSFTGFDLFGAIPPPTARYEVIASGRSSGIGGAK